MSPLRLLLVFGVLAAAGRAQAERAEKTRWPVYVSQLDASGQTQSWEALGPLLFKKPVGENSTSSGFRPFYVQTKNAQGETSQFLFAYPLFAYSANAETFQWSVLE